MEKNPQPAAAETSRAKIYLIIGIVSLYLMAFLWSLDASLIYIFLGVAVFFFYLAIRRKVSRIIREQSFSERVRGAYRAPSQEANSGSPDFDELLKQAQSRSKKTTHENKPVSEADPKRVSVIIISFIVFVVFLIIVLSIAFESEEQTEEISPTTVSVDDPYERGEELYRNGDYQSAYSSYKEALRENPQHAPAYVGYGSTLYMLGYPDSTQLMYDKALSIDPDNVLARYNKAWVYNDQKNYTQATIELRTLISKSPDYYDAYSLLGDIHYNQEQYGFALQSYETAYKNNFRNNPLCRTMGDLYVRQGDPSRGIALYKEALTYDSTDVYSHQKLGELLQGEEGAYHRTRGVVQSQ